MPVSRRRLLTYAGLGTYGTLVSGSAAGAAQPAPAAEFPLPRRRGERPDFFEPIRPSSADQLVLPNGYQARVLCRWDDPLGSAHPKFGKEKFGFNCDFLAYFPIDALKGGTNSNEGLLWVNHEYPDPLFVSRCAA